MNDCCGPAPGLLAVPEALERILAAVGPAEGSEQVPLDQCLDRVLAEDVHARIDVPPAANSAMDGYALRHADFSPGVTLPISGVVPAGAAAPPLAAGQAVRIFTGAPVPAGADTVVMQEVCERLPEGVRLPETIRQGSNIRPAGEDMTQGQCVLRAGRRLRPQDLGLAATAGHGVLAVRPRLRVAVLATGDELVAPGKPLGPGQIYDSNSFVLLGLLQRLGCQVSLKTVVADTLPATKRALREAASCSELIITSGGVSVGDEDHVKGAVEALGALDLWRIAIKPGKPVAVGRVDQTPFLGLPGNPVSVFVTFCLFGRPLVRRMQGEQEVSTLRVPVNAAFDLKPDGRARYLRARVEEQGGELWAELYGHQGSGVMYSTSWAHGLVEVPPDRGVVKGDQLMYLGYSELLA